MSVYRAEFNSQNKWLSYINISRGAPVSSVSKRWI